MKKGSFHSNIFSPSFSKKIFLSVTISNHRPAGITCVARFSVLVVSEKLTKILQPAGSVLGRTSCYSQSFPAKVYIIWKYLYCIFKGA